MKKISNPNRGRLWLACCIVLSLVTAMRWEAEPGTASAQPQAFYSWAEWYPMDRAQASGYRTYNWWTKTSGDPQVHGYYGQSIWNYPGAPEAFPERYRGTSTPIDYFFNWKCTYPRGDSRDPGCEIWTALPDWPIYSFREIISESANDEELQHWAFGSRTRWSVFYRRDAIVDGNGDPTCTRDNVQRYTAAYLQQGDVKQPLVMKLPDSGAYVGPPVCAIGYEGWDQRPDKVLADWTGNWFVETRFIAMSTTGNCSPYPCIQAENIYFSDNPSLRDTFTYCDDPSRPNYAAYCDSATRKGRLGTTYDGSEAVTGWAYAFERYWMRQVPSINRRLNGFGAFHWWTDDWDDYDWDDTFGSQPGDPLGWSTYQYCQLRTSGQDVTCCAAPVSAADFTWSPQSPATGQSVSFDASASGSSPITYNWNFGDGNLGSGDPASHTYTRGGSYTVILTATNSCGRQVVKETFQVCAPVASASFSRSPQNPTTGQSVSFNASAKGSSPITYNWDLGDNTTASGASVTHEYAAAGVYTITLTAENDCGQDKVSQSLTVTADPVPNFEVYLPLVLCNN